METIIVYIVGVIIAIITFVFFISELSKVWRILKAHIEGDTVTVDRLMTTYQQAQHDAYWQFDCDSDHFADLVKKHGTPYDALCAAEEEWLETK